MKEVLKKSGLVFGISKHHGFSLIELVVVIAIIAIMTALIVPRFSLRQAQPQYAFLNALNALVRTASTNAIMAKKMHRLVFDLQRNLITIERAKDKRDSGGEEQFEPLPMSYTNNQLIIPSSFVLRHFYIKGVDELAGHKTTKVWFFVTPQARAQEVTLVFDDNESHHSFSLVLNPFLVRFDLYEKAS